MYSISETINDMVDSNYIIIEAGGHLKALQLGYGTYCIALHSRKKTSQQGDLNIIAFEMHVHVVMIK